MGYRDTQALAQVQGCIVGALAGGVGPEVEGVARAAALEAVEDVLLHVDGEAARGAARGAVQRARTPLLGALGAPGLEAEQVLASAPAGLA